MGYDNAGDFYPFRFDALLRPKRKPDGTYAFTLFQLGAALEAERVGAPPPVAARWSPSAAQLKDYDGSYPLAPTFALRVFADGAKLFIQGTNQAPIEVAAIDKDVFTAERVGAEIDFERDADGKVTGLTSSRADRSSAALRGASPRVRAHPKSSYLPPSQAIAGEAAAAMASPPQQRCSKASHPPQSKLLTAGLACARRALLNAQRDFADHPGSRVRSLDSAVQEFQRT
jgi:hypothetical protein